MEQSESIPVKAAFSVTMKALERLSKTGSLTERAAIQRSAGYLANILTSCGKGQPESILRRRSRRFNWRLASSSRRAMKTSAEGVGRGSY